MVHVSFESTREGHYGFNGAFQRMKFRKWSPFWVHIHRVFALIADFHDGGSRELNTPSWDDAQMQKHRYRQMSNEYKIMVELSAIYTYNADSS